MTREALISFHYKDDKKVCSCLLRTKKNDSRWDLNVFASMKFENFLFPTTPVKFKDVKLEGNDREWSFVKLDINCSDLLDPAQGYINSEGALTVKIDIFPCGVPIRG